MGTAIRAASTSVAFRSKRWTSRVWQISKLDDGHALMLVDSRGKVAFVPGNATAQAPAPVVRWTW